MCCADEAALCAECDARVHAANKLAGKHQRVNLLYPEPEDLPSCDICQDKVGYFFCLEDRALLCRSCDYSIHSTNALAAKHKRFLVSGIRVSLQALLATNEGAESTQGSTSSQIRSSTTQASQMNSPGMTSLSKASQLSSGVTTCTQECQRIVPSSSPILQQSPPLYAEKLPTHEQTENRGTYAAFLESKQLQQPVAASTEEVRVVLPTNLALVPVNPYNHQVHFNSDWEMHPSIGGVHHHNMNVGGALASQRGGGGFVRRSSISEYLTETIPGWRVDELLSLTDAMSTRFLTDCGSSKTDTWNYGDTDWQADYNSVEDMIPAQGPAEVPSIPSPPTFSGIPRSVKTWGLGKNVKPSELDCFLEYDKAPVVPDIGGDISPPAHSPTSQPQKRRRNALDF